MAVTEVLKGLGSWGLSLQNVPQSIVSKIRYFGHVSIHIGQYDYRTAKDSALTSSRYTGVVRKKEGDGKTLALGGPGMTMWLGDEDKKGDVYETLKSYSNSSFEDTIRDLLPAGGAVTEGTLFNIGQNYTGSFVFQSPREAIEYVTETLGAEYIVRGDGTIDAGLIADLYAVDPKAILIRKGQGADMDMRALIGEFKTSQDVEDFTTRAVLLANGSAGSLVTASADINPGINPYRDIHGNFVKMTRLVSESATDTGNADARAQLALNRFTSTRDALTLSSSDFDIKGDVQVGDYLYIYDPELDLVDGNNEKMFRGVRYNPMKIRLTEMTWGVPKGYSVGYRDWQGEWFNLTEYLVPESAGSATLVVGGYNKSLNSGADGGVGGSRPIPDTTVPGVPTWTTPFVQSVYQSAINGDTKAQVQLKWLRPNNVDGSTIIDGDHYDIRWRNSTTPIFPSTHAQMSFFTHGQLKANGGTYGQPIAYPAGPWNYATAPWSELTFLLQELAPNMPYEAQIRAVDAAAPANAGAWSTLTAFQTSGDTLPPAVPAPPDVFASRIAVQIVHYLGRQSGGTFNLDADLHHLDIHGEYEPNFTPSPATLLGKIIANNGMISGQVPAVGTIQIERTTPTYFKVIAVDTAGNASEPSTAVQQTAELIDDAHIDSLTVSKVTAGTITADWLVAAKIATGFTKARVGLDMGGVYGYDAGNDLTFWLQSDSGDLFLGGNIDMPGAVRINDGLARKAELGLLSDGSYGIAVVNNSGQVTKMEDFVFGPQTANVDAAQSTGSGAFTDLATFGPSITVEIGPTRRCMILANSYIQTSNSRGAMGIAVSGASSIGATFARCVGALSNSGPAVVGAFTANCVFLTAADGLNQGSNTFTAKYSFGAVAPALGGGAGTGADFQYRRIAVFPY